MTLFSRANIYGECIGHQALSWGYRNETGTVPVLQRVFSSLQLHGMAMCVCVCVCVYWVCMCVHVYWEGGEGREGAVAQHESCVPLQSWEQLVTPPAGQD